MAGRSPKRGRLVGPQYQGAMTGFALLAFLGHGELPVSPEFGPTVQKGLDWLVENGKKNDGRLSMEKSFNVSGVYAHAIATFALGEYYTMTKDERVAESKSPTLASPPVSPPVPHMRRLAGRRPA